MPRKHLVERMDGLLKFAQNYFEHSTEEEISKKPSPSKWSKKEIFGHLIDSAVNNLQRFTEIQFESKPYKIRKYNQDELVKANNYQYSDIKEILGFWLSINKRIAAIMNDQTDETLDYEIELDAGKISDLRFLMNDYLDHMEYHLNQLK